MITLRLSATVAPYLDAIKAKRDAGWRWSDIRAALGLADCSDAAVAQAVRRCRWTAEQLPLPENVPAQQQKPGVQQKPAQTGAVTNTRPLPELKKNGQDPYEERLAKLRAANIDTSSFEKE